MRKDVFGKIACAIAVFCVATVLASQAQTFKTLLSFDGTDGSFPSALIQGTDGNFYGTTYSGGTNTGGSVFRITSAGKLTTLYNFCSQTNCVDGRLPFAGLVQAANGNLYGTTYSGGANDGGTVFQMTLAGKLTTLYSFCSQTQCNDGSEPYAGSLVQGTNGELYGTTYRGGIYDAGTVFEITPAGKLTTFYSFCAGDPCPDGSGPWAGLVQASNGNFYGTTYSGGNSGKGTVFELTSTGKLTTLYSFCSQTNCSDGTYPTAGLVQGSDGNLYGTTSEGGVKTFAGTVFKISPGGMLTTLYSFCSQYACPDGDFPEAGVVQGTDGNFYGTTQQGGSHVYGCGNSYIGCGTIFQITPMGKLTTLYSFCDQSGCTDGNFPQTSLMQATDGNFYGSANNGGSSNQSCNSDETLGCGTLFGLSMGLGPFVQANPNFGKAGRVIGILGNNLPETTIVSFNGTPAEFKVISGTYIKAQVPTDAATGTIDVTTPGGTLPSSVPFQVIP